jgi:hypothetical protein
VGIAALWNAAQPPKCCSEGAAQHVGLVHRGYKERFFWLEGEAEQTNAEGMRKLLNLDSALSRRQFETLPLMTLIQLINADKPFMFRR